MAIRGALLSLTTASWLALAGGCAGDSPGQDLEAGDLGAVFSAVDLGGAIGVTAAPGDPLPGLTAAQLDAFLVGLDDFSEEEEIDEGLGLIFNDTACRACHDAPATGGSSASATTEVRFGRVVNGVFDPLIAFGGPVQQAQGVGRQPICPDVDFTRETIPPEANVVARRLATALFGLGLIERVPDDQLRAVAAAEAQLAPATAGRVSVVTSRPSGELRVGRFGWKSAVATLFEFSGNAYVNEMGITNPLVPAESCFNGDCALTQRCDTVPDPEDDGSGVQNFTSFMTFLAPTPILSFGDSEQAGAVVFGEIGCANCHTPTLVTGASADPVFDRKTFAPFSDFLLHDMGPLGDGIGQGAAGLREMRTAPLWGNRFRARFLHDGRAGSVGEAILLHAGQGRAAADAFRALSNTRRSQLLAFLRAI
jgi:CxxC motif-containing protein (DUF1111 family)